MGIWWNGRHASLRNSYRKVCEFESHYPYFGPVAQLVERMPEEHSVVGSTPTGSIYWAVGRVGLMRRIANPLIG